MSHYRELITTTQQLPNPWVRANIIIYNYYSTHPCKQTEQRADKIHENVDSKKTANNE